MRARSTDAVRLVSLTLPQTLSAINAFFHAMVLYPDAQRTAQEELDRVLDGSRLPTLHDRAQAPYVEALVRETMRMYPVTPLGMSSEFMRYSSHSDARFTGLAHRLIEDDEYEGMRLPKGATVIVNTWYAATPRAVAALTMCSQGDPERRACVSRTCALQARAVPQGRHTRRERARSSRCLLRTRKKARLTAKHFPRSSLTAGSQNMSGPLRRRCGALATRRDRADVLRHSACQRRSWRGHSAGEDDVLDHH